MTKSVYARDQAELPDPCLQAANQPGGDREGKRREPFAQTQGPPALPLPSHQGRGEGGRKPAQRQAQAARIHHG